MGLFFKKKAEDELTVPPAPEFEEISAPEFPEIPEDFKTAKPRELEHEMPARPLFMSLGDYKGVIEEIELTKNIMREAEDAAVRIEEFSVDEEQQFKKWQSLVSDVQKNLIYCEKTLFR